MNSKKIEALLGLAITDKEAGEKIINLPDHFWGDNFAYKTIRDAIAYQHENGIYEMPRERVHDYCKLKGLPPNECAAVDSTFFRALTPMVKPSELPILLAHATKDADQNRAKQLLREGNIADALPLAERSGLSENSIKGLTGALLKKGKEIDTSLQWTSTAEMIADESIVEPEPIVNGVMRRREVSNIVGPPKARKSWLAYDLAIALEHGLPWLGFQCAKSKVLYIDRELHAGTVKRRLQSIYDARGLEQTHNLCILSTRGKDFTLDHLHAYAPKIKEAGFDAVFVDPMYRIYRDGFDENSNAGMARIYCELNSIAEMTDAAWFIIHHTSKGSQHGKSITDIGAGAGSQSRAADSQIVIRSSKKDGDMATEETAVMDAVVRSFAPVERKHLRWQYPRWTVDDAPTVQSKKADAVADFVAKYFTDAYRLRAEILIDALNDGMTEAAFKRLLPIAKEQGLVSEITAEKQKRFKKHQPQTF